MASAMAATIGSVLVDDAFSSDLDGNTGDALGDVLGDAFGETLRDSLGDSLGDDLGDALGDALGDVFGDAFGDSLSDVAKLSRVPALRMDVGPDTCECCAGSCGADTATGPTLL